MQRLIVDVDNKKYEIKSLWPDINLDEAIKLSKIEIPDGLRDLFAEKKTEWNDSYMVFYREIASILSNIPDDLLLKIKDISLIEIVNKTMLSTYLSCKYMNPDNYVYTSKTTFFHRFKRYKLPENKRVLGNEIIFARAETKKILEALSLTSELSSMPICISVLTSKYNADEWEIIKRASGFKNLSMDKVWNVFFCLKSLKKTPQQNINGYSQEKTKQVGKMHLKNQDLLTLALSHLSMN